MIKKYFLPILYCFFLSACGNTAGETKAIGDTVAVNDISVTKNVSDIEPGLHKTDSLQVLYYDNPDGDSLRYSRFFTYAETTDSLQIKALLQEMNQAYVQEPKARRCRSEGKLFLLRGEEVVKTIYFSMRGDSCRYFYFIRDGAFIYFPLTAKAEEWLKMNRQTARKP